MVDVVAAVDGLTVLMGQRKDETRDDLWLHIHGKEYLISLAGQVHRPRRMGFLGSLGWTEERMRLILVCSVNIVGCQKWNLMNGLLVTLENVCLGGSTFRACRLDEGGMKKLPQVTYIQRLSHRINSGSHELRRNSACATDLDSV